MLLPFRFLPFSHGLSEDPKGRVFFSLTNPFAFLYNIRINMKEVL